MSNRVLLSIGVRICVTLSFVTAQFPSNGPTAERACACCVGVEVGPALIRAGVFTSGGTLIGKTKFSTKIERGAVGVIPRIEKCIRYAVDECDLRMDDIVALGIGVPGSVCEESGLVKKAPQLAWDDIPLGRQIVDALGRPVAVANAHNFGAYGVYAQEAKSRPARFAAIFLGPLITGGFLAGGKWQNLGTQVTLENSGAMPELNVLASVDRPGFAHFRSRDFRKALRSGNETIREFALQIASKAGEVAAMLIKRAAPDMIAIGGGMVDEMKDDVLGFIRESALKKLDAPWPETTSLVASGLGDLAAITGAGLWAARLHTIQSETTALAS